MKKLILLTLLAAFHAATANAALDPPPCMSGHVYYDNNHNDNFDGGDAPMPGIWIKLYQFEYIAEPEPHCIVTLVDSTLTDAEGIYSFCDADLNENYIISQKLPQPYEEILPGIEACGIPGHALFFDEETEDLDFLDTSPEPDCCNSFQLEKGKRYWLSAWVNEAYPHTSPVKSYPHAFIRLEFVESGIITDLHASGELIDGWQRITGSFTVPETSVELIIRTINEDTMDAYFDDIRIHPFNASMKSYVYDPVTNFLTAELDDNNYATFYEYDNEGQLIRIKKETARGIVTIQESRSANPKKEDEE